MARMNNWKMALVVMITAAMLVFTGCTTTVGYVGNEYSLGSKGEMSGSYRTFNGTKDKTIKTDPGETIVFEYESSVKKGSLSLQLESPDGSKSEFPTGQSGTLEVKSEKGGKYEVIINGNNTGGSFDISWKVKN